MKIIIPKYNGRPMKLVKKYKHFAMFIDKKTGVKQCYQYWDLTHYINKYGEVVKLNDKGKLTIVGEKKEVPKQTIKNDLRLSEIIERIMDYEKNFKD